jgi:hypothetical protein
MVHASARRKPGAQWLLSPCSCPFCLDLSLEFLWPMPYGEQLPQGSGDAG